MVEPRRASRRGSEQQYDDAVDDSGAPAVANPVGRGDFAQFAWQKLEGLDSRMNKLSENYGRLDERLIAIQKALEKFDSVMKTSDDKLTESIKNTDAKLTKIGDKVSKLDGIVLKVTAYMGAGVTILGILYALLKAYGPQILAWIK